MYDVTLSEQETKLIRWSLQVAGDALAIQEETHLSQTEVMGFISQLDALDASLVSQIKPQRDALFDSEQLSFGV